MISARMQTDTRRGHAETPDFIDSIHGFKNVRYFTETLCNPLETEDYGIQCFPDASPPKWHLAHTTWFFETFLLLPHLKNYRAFNSRFHELFNSYYRSLGHPYARSQRGLLSRPTVGEVYAYRRHVDTAVEDLLALSGNDPAVTEILEWGLQHEQQHQELLVMDIQYNFAFNPLRPAYAGFRAPARKPLDRERPESFAWIDFAGGPRPIGAEGEAFSFDNERPRHIAYLQPYALGQKPVTCGEYLRFIEDKGYGRPELWLADGWDQVLNQAWEAPLYWERQNGEWWHYTLGGMQTVDPDAPVCHVSFYEADAYARWAGKRLPTETEWENAVGAGSSWRHAVSGSNFLESGRLQPAPAAADAPLVNGLSQALGDVWEWTQSAYGPYPGFTPPRGALGEYNGKFMNNQRVLRGGSCATPASHLRPTYRNFFRPEDRWPFTGIRLCADRT
ncbi:MAG: hypothetical protein K0Q91_1505 [Fibrobacteria bacterium]|nr:hypothetical protein [Fibrobacteria bacterium]